MRDFTAILVAWGLRDYGIPPTIWGGDPNCSHDFACDEIATEVGKGNWAQGTNGRGELQPGGADVKREPIRSTAKHGFCRCGAWSGALGLEPTYTLYVAHMVEVFRAVHRVLRKDGTLWLNLGDSYAGGGTIGRNDTTPEALARRAKVYGTGTGSGSLVGKGASRPQAEDLKPKDLCGLPWRVAFALQEDGWWLRQDCIWSKPNPMPESVTDRCTKSHEYLFLLSKSARYFYDAEAIKERCSNNSHGSPNVNPGDKNIVRLDGGSLGKWTTEDKTNGRNKRSVWEIATSPFPEAHFATFPPALIEPCVKAGTSARGCCAKCAAPWERETKQVGGFGGKSWHDHKDDLARGQRGGASGYRGDDRTIEAGEAVPAWSWADLAEQSRPLRGASGYRGDDRKAYESQSIVTLGWRPTCKCDSIVIPCTVLDPFGGAGTTGLVADRLGRDAILIDLNPDYVAMAERRVRGDAPLFAAVES